MFHHFTHVLGIGASRHQQSVVGLDHYGVVYPNNRHKLSGRVDIIAAGIQGKDALAGNQVAVSRSAFGDMVLVQRGPRAQIVPAKLRPKAVYVRGLLSLCRSGLEHGIVHADVLALLIQAFERRSEFWRSKTICDLLQQGRTLWKMLIERTSQRSRAPQEHSA